MPYDIRRTRVFEPDEIRFVGTRDGGRERCVVCLDPFTADASRVPMPALGAIPRGHAHPACKEIVRDAYLAALGAQKLRRTA